MVAAPFYVALTLKGTKGGILTPTLYASDVNAAKLKVDSSAGSDFLTLPSGENWILTDMSLSAAGTDTAAIKLRVNDTDQPRKFQNAFNLFTSGGSLRQVQQAPLGFLGGSKVEFVQSTN